VSITYPVAPVVRPADLTGQWNGQLADRLLVTVEGGGRLHHLAARAWTALVATAAAAGHELTYTFGGTYRSYAAQETLFRSRYAVGGTGGGCKLWNGQTWCKKSSGLATAAVPGTSNHGWGLAVDMAEDHDLVDGRNPADAVGLDARTITWLVAYAPRFGWSWETVPEEPWHIRYVAGDAVPQAVLDFERPPATDPTPTPPPESQEDDMPRTLVRDARFHDVFQTSPCVAPVDDDLGEPVRVIHHLRTIRSLALMCEVTSLSATDVSSKDWQSPGNWAKVPVAAIPDLPA
jgi:hypothetical protein